MSAVHHGTHHGSHPGSHYSGPPPQAGRMPPGALPPPAVLPPAMPPPPQMPPMPQPAMAPLMPLTAPAPALAMAGPIGAYPYPAYGAIYPATGYAMPCQAVPCMPAMASYVPNVSGRRTADVEEEDEIVIVERDYPRGRRGFDGDQMGRRSFDRSSGDEYVIERIVRSREHSGGRRRVYVERDSEFEDLDTRYASDSPRRHHDRGRVVEYEYISPRLPTRKVVREELADDLGASYGSVASAGFIPAHAMTPRMMAVPAACAGPFMMTASPAPYVASYVPPGVSYAPLPAYGAGVYSF